MSKAKNNELVKQHHACGQKAYKEGRYEDAWKNFDKAISFGGKTILLLDCKAAAMAKLPEWRKHAYEVTKDMIVKYPNNWEGPYRQAKVLQSIGLLDKALYSASIAVKLSPKQSANANAFRAIQTLRADLVIAKDRADRLRAKNDDVERARQAAARRAAIKAKINYTHLLSPDVLVTICEHGMRDNSGFVMRMSGVCKAWRGILANQGSLWNSLVLGRRKVVEKARMYMERTNGRIKEIVFAKSFDESKFFEVTEVLRPCLKDLRHLHFAVDPERIADRWKGSMHRLVSLRVSHDAPYYSDGLVFDMLSSDCTTLRELDMHGGIYRHIWADNGASANANATETNEEYDPDGQPGINFWTRAPKAHLGGIQSLRLTNATLRSEWHDMSELLCHFPTAHSIQLANVTFEQKPNPEGFSAWYKWRSPRDIRTTLTELRSFSQTSTYTNFRFDDIHAPNLLHLDIWSLHLTRQYSIAPYILAPGLELALPKLVSLDIGKCAVEQVDLLSILGRLPSLQFLNVSFCPLSNDFLEALERKGEAKDLLPRLTALSIAGNLEITAGPLRRMVYSRLSRTRTSRAFTSASTTQPSSQLAGGKAKGSAMRPSAPSVRASPFGPTKPKPSPMAGSKRNSSLPTATSASARTARSTPGILTRTPSISSAEHPSQAEQTSAPVAPAVASLNWLCIDNCESIEPELSDQLRSKVRFLSHSFAATPVEQRIRGKGRWAWDAEYTQDCGAGTGGCGLRKMPGTKDGWYVHHTCEAKEVEQPEKGWFWTPSQAQAQVQAEAGGSQLLSSSLSSSSGTGIEML